MKNLLITGGCGFIGSNFINYFFHLNKDVNIINYDAMYYCANEMNINEWFGYKKYLSRNGFQDLSWKSEAWSWKFVRTYVRTCFYPPLASFYFRF